MATDLLEALARCNLAAAVAILALWPLRAPLRRWFGAGHAYAVWLLVPLAAAGSLMPAGLAPSAAGPVETTNDRFIGWLSTGGHASALILVWISGVLAAIAVYLQARNGELERWSGWRCAGFGIVLSGILLARLDSIFWIAGLFPVLVLMTQNGDRRRNRPTLQRRRHEHGHP